MAGTLRVYFVGHADDRFTGILMRAVDRLTDGAPPTAIGDSEDDVYRQLEVLVAELEAKEDGVVERFLWEEDLATREVAVRVHPQTAAKRRMVIGKSEIPLRMTYVFAKLAVGGYRVMLPRFGWWFVLEELSLAQEVLASSLAAALLGATGKSVYDFRREGEEWVREWSPRFLRRDAKRAKDDDDDTPRPTLDAVAEEIVDKAARGKLPPVVGDWPEIAESLSLFDRDPLPSILIVGGAGVGKSTWVRRLARHFAQKKRDADGKSEEHVPRIWSTSSDRLLAGMVYLGMWQKRCLDLVRELAHEGDYLYVDRLVSLAHAQPDGGSIADILLPAMLAEEISVIAECSEEELERCQRRAATLVGAFRIVRIEEPPAHRMPALLDLYAKKRESLALHPSALQRAVHHLGTFQRDLRFPGKAFRFIDWLAQSASPATKGATPRALFPSDVSDAFSRWSGLPIDLVSDDRAVSHETLASQLRRGVIGQDHACELAAKVLARLKAGLNDPEKPCGTMLFVGPTGVGKTELAKQLAAYLFGDPKRMIRLDMSEYMLGGAAQRLLAVGDGGRSLAEQVRAQPLSLVLLDEIEKAHPEVFDLLLGVLGEGRLTDELGRLVDFRMTVIVMTSNLGASDATPVGFDAETPRGYERAVRDHFRPELFNRIDHVVSFQRLSRESIVRIVDLALDEMRRRTGLVRRNLSLEVHADARARLADLGFNPLRGARPLKRAIEEHVVAPVAALLAREPKLRDRTIVLGAALDVSVRASRSS